MARGGIEDFDEGNEDGIDPGQQFEVSTYLAAAQIAYGVAEVARCE